MTDPSQQIQELLNGNTGLNGEILKLVDQVVKIYTVTIEYVVRGYCANNGIPIPDPLTRESVRELGIRVVHAQYQASSQEEIYCVKTNDDSSVKTYPWARISKKAEAEKLVVEARVFETPEDTDATARCIV